MTKTQLLPGTAYYGRSGQKLMTASPLFRNGVALDQNALRLEAKRVVYGISRRAGN
ncbi:hypothetical protein J2D73_08820 [Acetobacter sacchari]|uniref:Uncharacterized protein n=1 Tax=Acetobacter sacchari TaxID=2661687 RepID=A0ABS3LVK4_9PROT|nr:hypothetical protein [Acetobacter sacchari]MBO1359896.1 hypothetical protein [Acetobacter sacchari]